MKTKILITAMLGLIGSISLNSCKESSERKVENAEEEVMEAKEELQEAKDDAAVEWEQFKMEADKTITDNDMEIKEFRLRMDQSGDGYRTRHQKTVDELEGKNREMKARIEVQSKSEERKEKWAEFKREFNHDMDELGAAIKNLDEDNKN